MRETAFLAAVRSYEDMVYRVALHALGNGPDAEDAVQEVLLRLYMEKKPFEGEEHLRRWLLRVTVNYCRDVLRSPWRKRRVDLAELPPPPVFEEPGQARLYEAVMSLPEKYRTVLDLYYYEELSVREIGELIGEKTTTVTTRLSRARKLLKDQLSEVWQDDE